METGINALKRAISLIGSQTKAAEIVGVKQPTMSWTVNSGERVPAEWCIPLETATQGQVTRHELRPDLYPVEETRSSNTHQAAE